MWADLTQSVEDLNRTKRLSDRELLMPEGWSWSISLLSATKIYPFYLSCFSDLWSNGATLSALLNLLLVD